MLSNKGIVLYGVIMDRYHRNGEEMKIWTVNDGHSLFIKDMNDEYIKDYLINRLKKNSSAPIRKVRYDIFNDVLQKRRRKKLEKIVNNIYTK